MPIRFVAFRQQAPSPGLRLSYSPFLRRWRTQKGDAPVLQQFWLFSACAIPPEKDWSGRRGRDAQQRLGV